MFTRFVRVVVAVLVLLAQMSLTRQGSVASAASTTITGLVFQDYNSNGEYDSAVVFGEAIDTPLNGITVRAFDTHGNRVNTTETGSDGSYTLYLTDAISTDVRVEFSWPSTGPLAAMQPSFEGADNGGAIQFVNVGDTNVNFALNVPGEFCQSNPNIAVTRQCWMDTGVGDVAGSPSIFVSHYNSGPLDPASSSLAYYNDWNQTKAAAFGNTGSVHGTAWDVVSQRLYTAAYVRRGVPMYENPTGTPLPGAIFVTIPNATKSSGAGGSTQFLVNLESLMTGSQFSNLTAPASGVADAGFTGYIPSNATRGLSFTSSPDATKTDADIVTNQDGVYEEVGRAGIGDIDVDDNGHLWVVSLYTRELYDVTLNADGSAPTTMTSAGSIVSGMTCNNGVARPHGLTTWRGSIYVGVVCDGSLGYNNAAPTDVNGTKNLTFSIRRYDPVTQLWSTFFGPQNLYRLDGSGNVLPFKGNGSTVTEYATEGNIWNPWTDKYSSSWASVSWGHPVPMLSDIEFDRDGSMVLGFRDQMKDALVNYDWTSPSGGREQSMIAPGDIYRVCRTGTGYAPTDYVFEGGTGCVRSGDNNTVVTSDDEYYKGDKYGPCPQCHGDLGSGLTEQVPGFPEVLMTAFDPFDTTFADNLTWNSGGIKYLSNATGESVALPGLIAPTRGIPGGVMYVSVPDGTTPIPEGSFFKSNAMGDIESLCDQAPLQIGNRVWNDENRNGVQDPGEDPIEGVTVHLYNSAGTLVGTAVTDAQGKYFFESNNTSESANGGPTPDSTGGGIKPNETFTVKLDNPADYAVGGPLENFSFISTMNSTTTEIADLEDFIDSDATLAGTGSTFGVNAFPTIAIPALAPGKNNQTFDFGLEPTPPVAVGDFTWVDTDGDGVQDAGEPALAGVTVELFDAAGNPARDANGNLVPAQTTDANGKYLFDNLLPGDYRMKFTPPAGYVTTAATAAAGTSATDSDPDPATGLTDVFTIAGAATGDTIADTNPSTVARFVNPTIDAGYIPTVAVGNYTWVDTNANGVQDAGEPALAGVTVEVLDKDGNPARDANGNLVPAQTTDANGKYFFDNLLPGDYRMKFTPPSGWVLAPQNLASATNGSDPNQTTGLTNVFTIAATATGDTIADSDPATLATFVNPTIDAGFAPRVSVGNRVWMDTDRDGVQDLGEKGIAGVTLTITNADGSPVTDVFGRTVTTTVTDANGNYSFDDLPPGQYKVTVTPPADVLPTRTGAGTTATDSSRGTATSTSLATNGARDPSLDFGFYPIKVSVGDRVWRDLNGDGYQSRVDYGIAGATLRLYDNNGNPARDTNGKLVPPQTTGRDGRYLFTNLPPGSYSVKITYPRGFRATTENRPDRERNSSTNIATSVNLTTDGAKDLSLDFGVVGINAGRGIPWTR